MVLGTDMRAHFEHLTKFKSKLAGDGFHDPSRMERKDTRLARLWPYAASPGGLPPQDADVEAYTDLMAASQDMVADLLHEITGTDAEEVLFQQEEL